MKKMPVIVAAALLVSLLEGLSLPASAAYADKTEADFGRVLYEDFESVTVPPRETPQPIQIPGSRFVSRNASGAGQFYSGSTRASLETEAAAGINKAMKIKRNGVFIESDAAAGFPVTYLCNSASSAADALTQEGKNARVYTELDIKLNNYENSAQYAHVYIVLDNVITLRMSATDQKIYRLTSGATAGGNYVETGASYSQGKWYRIRFVTEVTDDTGAVGKVSVYIDGAAVITDQAVLLPAGSTLQSGTAAYNGFRVQMHGSVPSAPENNDWHASAMVDNLSVYKYSAQAFDEGKTTSGPSVDSGKLIAAIRRVNAVLPTIVAGPGENEYYPGDVAALQDKRDEALAVYGSPGSQAAADTAANGLLSLLDALRPNGKAVSVSPPVYTWEDAPLADLLTADGAVASVDVRTNHYAPDENKFILVTALLRKDGRLADGRVEQVAADAASLGRNGRQPLAAALDLSAYSEEERGELFVKTMVWSGAGAMKPLLAPADQPFGANSAAAPVPEVFDGSYRIVNKVIDEETLKIVVTVKTTPGSHVALSVLKRGLDYPALSSLTAANAEQVLDYVGQTAADADGYAVFEFMPRSGNGDYKLRISGEGIGTPYDDTASFLSMEDISSAFSDLQAQTSPSDMAAALERNKENLQINIPLYANAAAGGIDTGSIVWGMIEEKTYTSFDLGEFRDTLLRLLAAACVNGLSDNRLIDSVINSGAPGSAASILGLRTDQSERYQLFEDYQKFTELLKRNRPYTLEGFSAAFDRLLLLAGVRYAANNDTMRDVLLTNRALVPQYAGYSALGGEGKILACAYLLKRKDAINTMAELEAEMKNAIAAGEQKSDASDSRRSGGGGPVTVYRDPALPAEEQAVVNPAQAAAGRFKDLDSVPWAAEAISVLAARGVVSGRAEGEFAPNSGITRAEFVKMAVSAFGMLQEDARCSFADVAQTDWAYPYIASAQKLGLVNGVGAEVFGAEQPLTRQDMSVLILRFAALAGISFSEAGEYLPFDDEEAIEDYARQAVKTLARSGVVNGMGSNLFSPWGGCTRAQVAKVLYETYKLLRL